MLTMNKVKVNVFKTKVFISHIKRWLHICLGMIVVPEFTDNYVIIKHFVFSTCYLIYKLKHSLLNKSLRSTTPSLIALLTPFPTCSSL